MGAASKCLGMVGVDLQFPDKLIIRYPALFRNSFLSIQLKTKEINTG